MIPPHLFYQIYLYFLEQNDCTPPKCGERSSYTDSGHTEVEDLSSRYMNGSDACDRYGYNTRQLHPSPVLRGKSVHSWYDGSSDRSFMVDLLSYFSFQQVPHDWCNKGRGMCYPVCEMVHIKEPLLLIGKSSP